jgi:hypothetical protein
LARTDRFRTARINDELKVIIRGEELTGGGLKHGLKTGQRMGLNVTGLGDETASALVLVELTFESLDT